MTTRVQRSEWVPYSAEQMFNLVNDIESYPEFLPHCRSARILESRNGRVKATIELAKGALHKSFTTWNRLEAPRLIDIRLVDGPFRSLHGSWSFTEQKGRGTRIALDLEFEFSSRLMSLAIGPVFNHVANSLVDAFVRRAKVIHGEMHG
nr:type II toxin-antitoxin system RatA family toxin [Thioalkalivibrio sp.]